MEYKLEGLENGITVLKVPIAASESVSVNFFVKTGSRNETARVRGVSHFLEHLLFKGTKKYPSAKILSSTVEAVGADYNAATSKEYTVYYIKAAAKHIEMIFDVLSDMLQHPNLNAAEIEREKGVIIEEMNMYRDTPMRYVGELLEEQMWPSSDIGDQIIGSEKTVRGIMRPDMQRYVASQYVNQNLILAIAGKFDDMQVNNLIAKHWNGGRSGLEATYTPAPESNKSPRVAVYGKKTEQAHLALGFYSFGYNHPDVYILEVLSNLLGGGMSARLFTEIRERRGLAYYVRMGTSHYLDTGATSITAGLRIEKMEEALCVISTELRKIRKTKVLPQELVKAKENLKGKMTLALEDSETKLEWYLEQAAFHHKIISPHQAFKEIDAVTPHDLQRLANQLFTHEKTKLSIIGPYKGKEKAFEKKLQF